jgi:uncharacterized protein
MKLVSGSLLVTLVSTTAWAAAPTAAPVPAAVAAQSAPAAAAERLALAREFVTQSTSVDHYMAQVHDASMRLASEAVINNADASDTPPDKIMADVDKLVARLEPPMRAHIPQLFEAYAQAYAREFSADELRALVAFGQSPAGKHYLDNEAFMMTDPGVMKVNMEMMESMQPVLENLAREACAKHTAERIAAGDKKATCPLAKAAETRAG